MFEIKTDEVNVDCPFRSREVFSLKKVHIYFLGHVLQLYSCHTEKLSAFTMLCADRAGARFTLNSLHAALLYFFDMRL